MLAPDLSLKEMRQEIYRLRRELRADLKEVRELSRTSSLTIPQDALKHMRDLEKRTTKSKGGTAVSHMGERELRNLYRDLEYVRGLKSSTPEGASKSAITWQPVKEFLDSTTEETRDKFWEVYNKLVSNRYLEEKFKYEIFEILRQQTEYGNLSDIDESAMAQLVSKLDDFYEEFTMYYGDDASDFSRNAFKSGFSDIFSQIGF